MGSPKVSICVPTYNGASYLRECLESIACQTLRDFEVIVVDDASTDRTLEIANDFAERDHRFRVFANQARLGLAANWNRAIEIGRGEWIKFLFQDDVIHENCLSELVSACENSKCRFAFCRRELLLDRSVAPKWQAALIDQKELLDRVYGTRGQLSPDEFTLATLSNRGLNLVGEPTATLFHRSVVDEVGWFEPSLIQLADTEYWTRLGTNFGVVQVKESLAKFRVHNNSTTARNLSRRHYRMQVIDPLIQTYLMSRKSYYRNFRRLLRLQQKPFALWRECLSQAGEAWRQSRVAESVESPGATRCSDEWNAAVRLFPALQIFALIDVVFSKLRNLRQTAAGIAARRRIA